MHRVLKPGGFLFIRVPAFMWLWSSHDEELQVRYRYQREELSKKLADAGVNVHAVNAACGPGGYGMILWVKPESYPKAAKALGV